MKEFIKYVSVRIPMLIGFGCCILCFYLSRYPDKVEWYAVLTEEKQLLVKILLTAIALLCVLIANKVGKKFKMFK